jgi:hypothetical protein
MFFRFGGGRKGGREGREHSTQLRLRLRLFFFLSRFRFLPLLVYYCAAPFRPGSTSTTFCLAPPVVLVSSLGRRVFVFFFSPPPLPLRYAPADGFVIGSKIDQIVDTSCRVSDGFAVGFEKRPGGNIFSLKIIVKVV